MDSIWKQTVVMPEYERLYKDMQVDVAVIGAGMAGILIANNLQEKGMNVIVLEAAKVGSGQTGNTSAKITAQHNMIYSKLLQQFGEEKAREYLQKNQHAMTEYERIIKQYDLTCHFKRCNAVLYSNNQIKELEEEFEAAKSLGAQCKMAAQTELPFEVAAALSFEHQACFHPLMFLGQLSKHLKIYEHTPVKEVKENLVVTEFGTVTARFIVFATHYPFINTPGFYFMRMHQERSYCIAVQAKETLHNMYLGIDGEDAYSFRSFSDMIIIGGEKHRTGENSAGGRYDKLKLSAKKYYGEDAVKAQWSAQDCMTIDGIPYIGQFAKNQEKWYVATGFGKWGMTLSMVAAAEITNAICNEALNSESIFSPQRFPDATGAKNMVQDGIQAAKGIFREYLHVHAEALDQLPISHGGIVEYAGHKVGVYKDEKGELFIINPKCPHLGCQLEWNPDEKSWDCPCHGSRFDFRGRVLDNPAQINLEYH